MMFHHTYPSENDLLMMNETEYNDHMLLTTLDDHDDEHSVIPASLIDEEPSMTLFDQEDAAVLTRLCRKVTDTHDEEEEEGEEAFHDDNDTKPLVTKSSATTTHTRHSDDDDDSPSEHDVLCGQSRNCANHCGNKRFQSILESYVSRYSKINKKEEKMALTKEIVSKVQECGGRFLKKASSGNTSWIEISDVAARDKISHALRTKVTSWKKRAERKAKESTVAAAKSKKPTHRRKSTTAKRQQHRRRRSSCNSTSTFASLNTAPPTPMSSASSSVMEELMRRQKEIFASLVAESCEIEGKDGDIHPLKRE